MADRQRDFTDAIARAVADRQTRPELVLEPGKLPDGTPAGHHWTWAEEEARARTRRFLELNIGD